MVAKRGENAKCSQGAGNGLGMMAKAALQPNIALIFFWMANVRLPAQGADAICPSKC